MLEQIKRKRLAFTNNMSPSRTRLSSAERRRKIEANLVQFKKDVQQSERLDSSRKTNGFNRTSNQDKGDIESPKKNEVVQEVYRKVQEQVESPRFIQQKQHELTYSQASPDTSKKLELSPYIMKDSAIHDQNPAPSQQNQRIIENKYDDIGVPPQTAPKQQQKQEFVSEKQDRLERQLTFGVNNVSSSQPHSSDLSQLQYSNNTNTKKQIETPLSDNEQLLKVLPPLEQIPTKTGQLNFNYNESRYGNSSSNRSSAILFTSQFRQYLNQNKPDLVPEHTLEQKAQQKDLEKQPHSISSQPADKQLTDSFLKMAEENLSQMNSMSSDARKLSHNQSGRSLAFSNAEESHRQDDTYRGYEAAYAEISKKLGPELVVQIGDFGKSQLRELGAKYHQKVMGLQMTELAKQIKKVYGIRKIERMTQRAQIRQFFSRLQQLEEEEFLQAKNQVKLNHFLRQKNERLVSTIFWVLKDRNLSNQKKVIYFSRSKDNKTIKNIFQVFKLVWFQAKIKNQADLYYLSKIFAAFRSTLARQKKKLQAAAIKHYIKCLKFRYFQKLQEGVQTLRHERQVQQLADDHYRIGLLKKCFGSWVEQSDRSPQYISLTMTSKNFFRQTSDNKWLEVKTVDFKQLKN